jgi:hypothetical protein
VDKNNIMQFERGHFFSKTLYNASKYATQTTKKYCTEIKDILFIPGESVLGTNIKCNKCSSILDNPRKIKCGHIFCYDCVNTENFNPQCKICKTNYELFDWSLDEECKNIINNIDNISFFCKLCDKTHKISERTHVVICKFCNKSMQPNGAFKLFVEKHLNGSCKSIFVGFNFQDSIFFNRDI